jgi:hypothetical protein
VSEQKPSVEGLMALVKRYGGYCAFSEDSEDAGAAARFNAIRTYATSLCAPSVEPEGWKLVPIKPTPKMVRAGSHHKFRDAYDPEEESYAAMLAASPSAPQPAEGAPGDTDAERAAWLADKIVAQGDYAKEAAWMLRRWPSAAPQPVAVEPRWMPIETAPRDKTMVALLHLGAGGGYCRYGVGWYMPWSGWQGWDDSAKQPTHWMPLPRVPLAASSPQEKDGTTGVKVEGGSDGR